MKMDAGTKAKAMAGFVLLSLPLAKAASSQNADLETLNRTGPAVTRDIGSASQPLAVSADGTVSLPIASPNDPASYACGWKLKGASWAPAPKGIPDITDRIFGSTAPVLAAAGNDAGDASFEFSVAEKGQLRLRLAASAGIHTHLLSMYTNESRTHETGVDWPGKALDVNWEVVPGKLYKLVLHKDGAGWVALGAQEARAPSQGSSSSSASVASPAPAAQRMQDAKTFLGQGAHEVKSELDKAMASRLLSFGEALGIPREDLQCTKVARHGTFALAMSDKWLYRADVFGNQTFRPVTMVPFVVSHLSKQMSPDPAKVDKSRLMLQVRSLAARFCGAMTSSLTLQTCKREVLLFGETAKGSPGMCGGRLLGRMYNNVNDVTFQVMCDGEYKPIRVDLNVQTEGARAVASLISREFATGNSESGPFRFKVSGGLVGLFYSPSEYRFPVNVRSYVGEQFLDPRVEHNPYQKDGFDLSNYNFIDVNAYCQSGEFHFWSYFWWERGGKVGGLRGNFDQKTQQWEQPLGASFFPLNKYRIMDGIDEGISELELSDKRKYSLPHATSCIMEPAYFKDREECLVAVFNTHGGHLRLRNGRFRYQIQPTKDLWFITGSQAYPFGSGHLRHIFYHSCDSMNLFGKPEYSTLLTEWMRADCVDGVRTVSGADSDGRDVAAAGLDRDGWRVCKYLLQGDGICDSYLLGLIDECPTNEGVTVAYGATREEALTTLSDGSISDEKVKSTWAVASLMRAVP